MSFHHNGEAWVSQDKKRNDRHGSNLLTLVRKSHNKVLLHESDMDSASSRPARHGRVRPLRALQTTLGVAILLATLFTALPSRGLVSGNVYERLSLLLTLQQVDTILHHNPNTHRDCCGHSGNDSGQSAAMATQVTLTEADVNLEIARWYRATDTKRL
jgi:hypothetical protein